MILLFALIVSFNVFVVWLIFYNFYYKRRKFPPGPIPFPIVGNLFSLMLNPPGEDCHVKWNKQYGPIYTFWFGEMPVIIVSEYDKMIETFQRDGETYAGRYSFDSFQTLLTGGTRGVILTEGDLWREHRRFALHVFRDFGLGKNVMQEKILNEISGRFSDLDKLIGSGIEEISLTNIIDLLVGSIINSLLFGYRFNNEHEKEFFELKQLMTDILKTNATIQSQLLQWKPNFFKSLPFFNGILCDAKRNIEGLRNFLKRQIENHVEDIDYNNPISTDYVESYLKEMKRRELIGDKDHSYTMEQLVNMCSDLWFAGQETTSTTLAWGIAYLIHYPEYQKKMQAELDRVIGTTDRFVTVSDRPNLPYTCAVVNEISRIANLVPFNLLHRTTKDTTIDGYFIPKGTSITPQISAVLYGDRYFENPKQFNPERFIDENGQLKRCDELVPFSMGKRQCLGEALARMELFLVLANIAHKYKLEPGKVLPSLKRQIGATAICQQYLCKIQNR